MARSASRVSSCRFSAASTFGRHTRRTCSSVSEARTPSSSTPAAWTTPVRGCSAGMADRTAASWSRSAASQAATSTRAPDSSNSAASSAAPGASSPFRLVSTSERTPRSPTRCRARSEPSVPVPPVIRTVPSGSSPGGTVSTIFPMCLACDMKRNASGARRTSQVVTGSGRSAPCSNRRTISVRISPTRCSPASPRS